MTTLAIMKARIADDLARSDLTSQIANAINDAIKFYQGKRFSWNESRTLVTFNTVALQQDYGVSANADLPYIQAIDYIALTVSTRVSMLTRYTPEEIEDLTNNDSMTGEPYAYRWYKRNIGLYPIPDQVYPVRVAGHVTFAAPAADDTTGNAWMVEAEVLIRSRAKYELAMHVLRDTELAGRMKAAFDEAESDLSSVAARQTGSGTIESTRF